MDFEKRLNHFLSHIASEEEIQEYVFLSIGSPLAKAEIKRIKKSPYWKDKAFDCCKEFKKKTGEYPVWIKCDIVTKKESLSFSNLRKEMEGTRRNYIEYGVSLDNDFIMSFLPEEINTNAFLKPIKKSNKLMLSEKNINSYLDKYKFPKKRHYKGKSKKPYRHINYEGKQVIKFFTKSFFLEGENIIDLYESGYKKGLRKVNDLSSELDELIESGVNYLSNQLDPDGKYEYGVFPHFDRSINFYNNLRHSSSTYSLIEGLDYLDKDIRPAKVALDYIIENYFYEVDGCGYIYDDTNGINEIKLGQNAAFVFAACEYLKIHPEEESLLKAAQSASKGILTMIDDHTGDTTHILEYPSLSIKEKHRIVYYDGEAALALLRLYQIDQNEKWLNMVEVLFKKFIKEDYWKYRDHWLGYCTNELVQLVNEEKYVEFGLKNVSGYLDYIRNRETTFPTFLEMLMATYRLVKRAKETGFEKLVEQYIDEEELTNVIHERANYQRIGYFYPELAMYFKNPDRVLGSFFIKHHGYRVRIDDIEHYLSGFVQYQKVFE